MPDCLHAFGYWLEVRQDLRQRGYGWATTAVAKQKCHEMNVASIGPEQCSAQQAAQSLHEDLGFEVESCKVVYEQLVTVSLHM